MPKRKRSSTRRKQKPKQKKTIQKRKIAKQRRGATARNSKRQKAETLNITKAQARSYYNDSAGDKREEWADIQYFHPEEIEVFKSTGEQDGYAGNNGRLSVGKAIERVFSIYPNLDESTGQLYSSKSELKRKAKKVELYGLFVSDDGHFILRKHLFESKLESRDSKEFSKWFHKHYGKILRENILPHMSLKTPGSPNWRLYRVLGWSMNATSKRRNTGTHSKRNKTKKARR